jgi:hypothetical protein
VTEPSAERDDQRFQEVLGRLDALVRRGQGSGTAPPPSGKGEIPVLTEIYQPDQQPLIEPPLLTDILPSEEVGGHGFASLLVQVVEEVLRQKVQPELTAAINEKMGELRPQLEGWLQEALQRALGSKVD